MAAEALIVVMCFLLAYSSGSQEKGIVKFHQNTLDVISGFLTEGVGFPEASAFLCLLVALLHTCELQKMALCHNTLWSLKTLLAGVILAKGFWMFFFFCSKSESPAQFAGKCTQLAATRHHQKRGKLQEQLDCLEFSVYFFYPGLWIPMS